MRGLLIIGVLSAGCAFQVPGVGPGHPGTGGDEDPGAPAAPVPSSPPVSAGDDGGLATESTQIGDACDDGTHRCAAGQVCETQTAFGTKIPGGYCSADCSITPCPAGSQCAMNWGSFRVCIQDCPAAGCRAGYVCCMKGWAAPGACLTPSLCPGG